MEARADSERKLTYDDLAALPDDGQRHEIIDGILVVSPAPTPYHQQVSKRLQHELYTQVELAGRGEVFNAPVDVELSEHDVVEPDLLVIETWRRSIVTDTRIMGTPDLVIEILSPSTSRRDRLDKRELYERSGVTEYWIVDPEERVVTQWVNENGRLRILARETTRIVSHSLPGLEIDLTRIWAGPFDGSG